MINSGPDGSGGSGAFSRDVRAIDAPVIAVGLFPHVDTAHAVNFLQKRVGGGQMIAFAILHTWLFCKLGSPVKGHVVSGTQTDHARLRVGRITVEVAGMKVNDGPAIGSSVSALLPAQLTFAGLAALAVWMHVFALPPGTFLTG
jgi:hypothetical protein